MVLMTEMVSEKVVEFMRELLPERTGFLQQLEKECQDEYIPLVEPEVGQFLQVMVKARGACRVLEIGTGIGYSAILLAEAFRDRGGHLTTIEIDQDRYVRACRNFCEAGVSDLITALHGDANQIIPELCGSFDLIFMDAAKGQYPEFFARLWPLLERGGVLLIDNIFLNGWVIDMSWPERRKKTMVVRMRELLDTLKAHPDLVTSVIPLGDGLAVSVRR